MDTVLAASTPDPGTTKQTQSPWLFLDAAHTIFATTKRRVFTGKTSDTIDTAAAIPDSVHPVLEELPKWAILAEVLEEIETDVYFNPTMGEGSTGSTLIMCSSQATCQQLREYTQTMYIRPHEDDKTARADEDEDDVKPSASFMMRRRLRNYLAWKKDFAKVRSSLFSENQKTINGTSSDRNTQNGRGAKGPPNKRRRTRGGISTATSASRGPNGLVSVSGDRDSHIASLLADLEPTGDENNQKGEVAVDPLNKEDATYELYDMKDLVLVHPYNGDMDDHLLTETKPRYIVMYEPDPAFIRRVEVYRSSHTDRNVRVYFLYYGGSVEEQRYLSAVRREKDAFTRLIRERGVCALPPACATKQLR